MGICGAEVLKEELRWLRLKTYSAQHLMLIVGKVQGVNSQGVERRKMASIPLGTNNLKSF